MRKIWRRRGPRRFEYGQRTQFGLKTLGVNRKKISPLGEDYKPHPGGIGLGRFFALTNPTRMELHFGGFFAQTPPVWNWTWKIFRPNPTRMELYFGRSFAQMPPVWDFSPLGKNHRPCRGGIALGVFFALAEMTNPTRVELDLEDLSTLGRESQTPHGWNCTWEDLSPLGELQTPPGWNCTWKMFCP